MHDLRSIEKPVDVTIASIHDHALLLFLPQSDTQSLWRFDLDGLTEHGFRVTGRDGYYLLSLCTLDGQDKTLARFLDKQEAYQTLHLIHTTLRRLDTETPALATCPLPIVQAAHEPAPGSTPPTPPAAHHTRDLKRAMFGWLTFWRAVFLIALGALLFILLRPAALPVLPQPPSGVPLDADQALPH